MTDLRWTSSPSLSPRLPDVLVALAPGSEEVVEDKIGHVTTQLLTSGFVEAEMLPGEDATQCTLLPRLLEGS